MCMYNQKIRIRILMIQFYLMDLCLLDEGLVPYNKTLI